MNGLININIKYHGMEIFEGTCGWYLASKVFIFPMLPEGRA